MKLWKGSDEHALYISDLPFVSVYAHFNTDLRGHFRGPFSGLKLPTLAKTASGYARHFKVEKNI